MTDFRNGSADGNGDNRQQINATVVAVWQDLACTSLARQLLFGEHFVVLGNHGSVAFGRSEKDGYEGFVATANLVPATDPTHVVSALSSHIYTRPDIKSTPVTELAFGSRVVITDVTGRFSKTSSGHFIPSAHLRACDADIPDPVAAALMFEHVPYLWGGNSPWGIDCSGLVQAVLLAAGKSCPADAGMQAETLGKDLDKDEPLQRGDLLFWKGHVAIVLDRDTILHATAHYMLVVKESLPDAIMRIENQGEGPVTSRRRP